jgi:hypothetical protein
LRRNGGKGEIKTTKGPGERDVKGGEESAQAIFK